MTNPLLSSILTDALNLVNSQLFSFTTDPQFHEKLILTFGDAINPESYLQLWTNPDFNIEPVIEIRSQSELNSANGAYSAETNTIYIASEYLQQLFPLYEGKLGVSIIHPFLKGG